MGEETSDTVNLDWNLSHGPEAQSGSIATEVVNLDDWVDDPIDRIREGIRLRSVSRNLPMELDQLLSHSADGLLYRQVRAVSSVAAEEKSNEAQKTCKNNNVFLEDEVSDKKDDDEKGNGNDGSFFDYNICLDLARDTPPPPLVTCCVSLVLLALPLPTVTCAFRCKAISSVRGWVTVKNVTPMYGCENSTRESEKDLSLKIPLRPQGWRLES